MKKRIYGVCGRWSLQKSGDFVNKWLIHWELFTIIPLLP